MTRTIATSVAGLVLASAMVSAQSTAPGGSQSDTPRQPSSQTTPQTPSSSSSQANADVTMTGCLVPGSAAGVYVLDNARMSSQGTSGAGQRLVISASGASVDLAKNVNKQVTVSGSRSAAASSSMPPASAPGSSTPSSTPSAGSTPGAASSAARQSESALGRFTAKTIVSVGDSCSASSSD